MPALSWLLFGNSREQQRYYQIETPAEDAREGTWEILLEKLNAVSFIHPAATAQGLLCAFELYKYLQIPRSRLKGFYPCVKSPN